MARRIRYYGDPILRKKAEPIETFGTDFLRKLVQEMDELMLSHDGMGLAGPQVGESLRIFLTHAPYEEEGKWKFAPLEVFINPVLSFPSEEVWKIEEACVSLPKMSVPVERPFKITIEAYDIEGKPFKRTAEGMIARLYMHENDHLNGVLTIDRTDKKSKQQVERHLQMIKKQYNK